MTRRHRALTIIELLVVMAIMAMLTAILVSVLFQARRQAKDLVRRSDQRQADIAAKADTRD